MATTSHGWTKEMTKYRINFYNKSGKLFAYYDTNNKKAAEDMRDSPWSRAKVEMIENEYVAQGSTSGPITEAF